MSSSPRRPSQVLPPGLPRRFATYTPAPVDAAPPEVITDVGGYDELIRHFEAEGLQLAPDRAGLVALDARIGALPPRLTEAVAMYFGDVVIHSLPGSHWRVVQEGRPLVELPGGASSDVMATAAMALTTGRHTLTEVLDHLAALPR